MKKLFLLSVLFLGLIVLGVGFASSAECSADMNATQGYGNTQCTVSTSLTLNGTYSFQFNGTTNGVILINGSNLILDGNGSSFKGNFTAGSASFIAGIRINGQNVTVRNFNFNNYYYNLLSTTIAYRSNITNNNFSTGNRLLRVDSNNSIVKDNYFINGTSGGQLYISPGSNGLIINNYFNQTVSSPNIQTFGVVNNYTFTNNTFISNGSLVPVSIRLDATGYASNIYFYNNTFLTTSTNNLYLNNVTSAIISGNFFKGGALNSLVNVDSYSNLINITNNNFTGSSAIFSEGIGIFDNSSNINIFSNNITNTHYTIFTQSTTRNINISRNYLAYNDIGTRISGTNISFEVNTVDLPTNVSIDQYFIPFKSITCNNCFIRSNIFQNISQGIVLQNSTNIIINNNTFKFMPFSERQKYIVSNNRMGQCSINTVEVYTSWIGEDNEVSANDNITLLSQFASKNIQIYNNSFGEGATCYLYGEGTINLTHDFTDYWYSKFQTPTYLKNSSEYYVSNNALNVSWMSQSQVNYTIYSTYYGSARLIMQYEVFKDYIWFRNANNTQNYTNIVFNQTNSLIYFSNGSVACSNIATCDGNINITLTPNNYSYVLDNFNVTEGVSRQFSPISLSGTSTTKTITSTLSQSVNATVIVNVAQCDVTGTYQNIKYTPSCSGNIATFSLPNIPSGSSSLILSYTTINCSTNTDASVIIILVLTALAIMILPIIAVIKFRQGELDAKILIIVFVAIMVGIGLFISIAQNLGGVCSA